MAQRVLVIDNHKAVRNALSDSIRTRIDCVVHEAADLAEARALLECFAYALVVTDLSLTRSSLKGPALIEDTAANSFRTGLIAFSGQVDKVDSGLLALFTGADAFLPEPLPLTEFGSVLREFDASLSMASSSPANISPRLDEFLGEGGTRTYVQPIYQVDCAPAVLKSVEFLTRGPAGSLFERADVLFAYARAARMESILDRHCIQRALAAAVHIPLDISLSINVHASTLCKPPDFAEWFSETALSEGIDTSRITLEIVEYSPDWNQNAFLRMLGQLRALGMKIALDDIGLGHSNYQMMIDARPDCLKLDRYFVHGCSTDQYRKAVVGSVSRLATDFGATVIAEGVETADDLQELKAQGINLVQGYLFCPPKSMPDALASVLTKAASRVPVRWNRERMEISVR